MTHFINALQVTFPEGERFFMDAARDGERILIERMFGHLRSQAGTPPFDVR